MDAYLPGIWFLAHPRGWWGLVWPSQLLTRLKLPPWEKDLHPEHRDCTPPCLRRVCYKGNILLFNSSFAAFKSFVIRLLLCWVSGILFISKMYNLHPESDMRWSSVTASGIHVTVAHLMLHFIPLSRYFCLCSRLPWLPRLQWNLLYISGSKTIAWLPEKQGAFKRFLFSSFSEWQSC